MGEEFIRKCAPQFKYQQDKAYEQELKRDNLFSERKEVASREYTFMAFDGSGLEPGVEVIVTTGTAGAIVPTVLGVPVGTFEAADQSALNADMAANLRSDGVALASVYSICPLGGVVIRLRE